MIRVYGLITRTITGKMVFLYAQEEKDGWQIGDLVYCCSKSTYLKMRIPRSCKVTTFHRIECVCNDSLNIK